MTRTHNHRLSAGIVGVALALGTAAPASARPFNLNSVGSNVPVNAAISSVPSITGHPASRSGFDWGDAAIGSGVAALALTGAGGTLAASRRRQRRSGTHLDHNIAPTGG